jgi:hypothetical protein
MMLEVIGVRTESRLRLHALSHSPQQMHLSGSNVSFIGVPLGDP